jgi:hypothetical protein
LLDLGGHDLQRVVVDAPDHFDWDSTHTLNWWKTYYKIVPLDDAHEHIGREQTHSQTQINASLRVCSSACWSLRHWHHSDIMRHSET